MTIAKPAYKDNFLTSLCENNAMWGTLKPPIIPLKDTGGVEVGVDSQADGGGNVAGSHGPTGAHYLGYDCATGTERQVVYGPGCAEGSGDTEYSWGEGKAREGR